MPLKAIKPEVIQDGKPKFMISGSPGVGKTWFSLDFPNVYFIDTEGGAVRKQYKKKLTDAGGGYMGKDQGSQDFVTVINEIRALATEKHKYKTLVIDSFSYLYNMAAAIAEEKVGSSFGKDKKEANRPTRQLMRWLENLDMTVILICHKKDKWERKGGEVINVGTTFDGYDKLEYILDLWIEVVKSGKARGFIVKKSRIDSLPEGESYPLEFSKFSELYGKEVINKEAKTLLMAQEETVKKIEHLVDVLKIEPEKIEKWFDKYEVEAWGDMTEDQAQKALAYLKTELKKIQKEIE